MKEPFRGYAVMRDLFGTRYACCELRNFEVGDDKYTAARSGALKRVTAYAKSIRKNVRDGVNLVLVGSVGTGKDHLAVAVARVALGYGINVRVVRGSDLRQLLKKARWQSDRTARVFRDAELLIISDIEGRGETQTDDDRQVLLDLVDSRYREKKPVIVTSNIPGSDKMKEVLGTRTVDRLLEGAVGVLMNWPSYREKSGHA